MVLLDRLVLLSTLLYLLRRLHSIHYMDGRPRIESKLVTTPLQVALLLAPRASVDDEEEEEAEDERLRHSGTRRTLPNIFINTYSRLRIHSISIYLRSLSPCGTETILKYLLLCAHTLTRFIFYNVLFLGYDQITLRGTIFGEHWLILTLAVGGDGPGKG